MIPSGSITAAVLSWQPIQGYMIARVTQCHTFLTPQGNVVEFAEKPKGDALKGMRVDTTVLGVDPKT